MSEPADGDLQAGGTTRHRPRSFPRTAHKRQLPFDQRGNGATVRDRGFCDHEDPQAGSPPTLRPRRTVLGAFALLREYLAAKGDAVAADRYSGTR
jgi:hypothetical protein